MKPFLTALFVGFAPLYFLAPARAEDLEHLQMLLSTRRCPQCELSNAGLVQANLTGAQLQGANLVGANLSRANLSGANLTGANLAGASLHGANLQSANLTGANLTGVDLRGAYLNGVVLTGASLENAYVQGAIGIPSSAASHERFYSWGITEAQQGNYRMAIEHFNQSLALDSSYAPAYLARAVAHYRLGKDALADQDAKIASDLFQEQDDQSGYQAAQQFIKGIEIARQPRDSNSGGGQFDKIIQTVGSLLLQFIVPFF
jgi:tetratricopeptide (TPR) repeat protein